MFTFTSDVFDVNPYVRTDVRLPRLLRGCEGLPGRVEQVVQDVVLPLAGDSQVCRGDGERVESLAAEDALRPGVVQQGLGLQAVQIELLEREVDGLGHGGGGQAASV